MTLFEKYNENGRFNYNAVIENENGRVNYNAVIENVCIGDCECLDGHYDVEASKSICSKIGIIEEKCKKCWNLEYIENHVTDTNVGNKPEVTDGLKHDGGKPRLDLVPPELIEAVGAVRTYGVEKYKDEYSYRKVNPERYRAALMRHICAWLKNPHGLDKESGLPHIWHVACNVAFLIELDKE